MGAINLGHIDWGVDRDKEGHRDYTIVWKVLTTSALDGPQIVANCPGIPSLGSIWALGNDLDPWAFCWPDFRVRTLKLQDGPNKFWTMEQHFSTRPLRRCQDNSIQNPLNEPLKIGGGYSKRTIQGTKNKAGTAIQSSSHETFKGKNTEFEDNRPTVWCEANLATLPMGTFGPAIDHVNDSPLWGAPKRCVKLSQATWSRQLYATCNFYFTVRYEFDVDFNTFDRDLLDEGMMCLIGWAPGSTAQPINPTGTDKGIAGGQNWLNPANFERYKDLNGDYGACALDGMGRPLGLPATGTDPHYIHTQYYPETNLLALGIPTDFTIH